MKGISQTSRFEDILPEALIRYLAGEMLETHMIHNLPFNSLLLFTIKDLLQSKRFGAHRWRKPHLWKVAVLIKAKDNQISVNELAHRLGVNRSTVSHWLNDSRFLVAVSHLQDSQDELEEWSLAHENGFDLPDPDVLRMKGRAQQ